MAQAECVVKMRAFPNDTELQCQLGDGHGGCVLPLGHHGRRAA